MAHSSSIVILLTSLIVTSSALSDDDVESLIYHVQATYCGDQFCDPSSHGRLPPVCYDTKTDSPTGSKTRCPPCEECSCQDDCEIFGNCCADKHVGGKYFINCQQMHTYDGEGFYDEMYPIVTKCVEEHANYSEALADKCEHGEIDTVEDGRPVTTKHADKTYVTFKNKYCAMCYGVQHYSPWTVVLGCEDPVNIEDYPNISEVIRSVKKIQDCIVAFSINETKLPKTCPSSKPMVSSCNQTGKWRDYNESIERACHSFFNPTVDWIYRNIICFICNGEPLHELECPSQCKYLGVKPVFILPFTALLNFDNSNAEIIGTDSRPNRLVRIGPQERHQCRFGEIYDTFYKTCRKVYCPLAAERQRDINSSCISLEKSIEHVIIIYEATVYYEDGVTFKITENLSSIGDGVIEGLKTETLLSEIQLLGSSAADYAVIASPSLLEMKMSLLVLQCKFSSWSDFIRARRYLSGNVTLTVSWRGQQLTGVMVSGHPSRNDMLLVNRNVQDINLGRDLNIFFEFNVSCPIIRFKESEVKRVNQSDNLSVHEKIITKHEYFELNTGVFYVCLDVILDKISKGTGEKQNGTDIFPSDYHITSKILTAVCLSCSLLCLLLTLLVYILLKELHTVPGLNLILLTSSMFVAQVLYLFGAGTVTTPTICTVLGVLIHYFWLVSFAWMNVCCLHMYRVFTSDFNTLDFATRKTVVIMKYVVFAYGVPGGIIASTLLATYLHSGKATISYGGKQLCFVETGLISIISFGIPAGLTLVANTVLLLITNIALMKRKAHPKRNVKRTEANDISKFFKLSSITGMSWMFGFLGFFLSRVELLYIFTVLTAGQGVFIFISFVVSKRIFMMLKHKLVCRRK